MPDVSHPTESSPPDDRRPNFQAASDGSILTEKNDESERYWTLDVDIPSYDIPNPVSIHPRTVLICIFNPVNLSPWLLPSDLQCDFELTGSHRKLEEQVKHQDQENHRLHKRVSCICESVPTSLISPNLVVHFGTRLWKRNERRRAKEKRTERFSGQAGRGPKGKA
ncbi:hypothetical protein ASPFODRAFT_148313 [Aspergillus luchuensis CBS 106.47]|uniref:Uncharacterized protein n=1 Tax=Aspergillus luchuensis (strain CBS 106.47) TaxID=1137211 RepID=A0A1M3T002_ASPLC|nr:hypothetical protein ASPFODRAFT_148313 [Aspergillus luchuensis CBS 106.47]